MALQSLQAAAGQIDLVQRLMIVLEPHRASTARPRAQPGHIAAPQDTNVSHLTEGGRAGLQFSAYQMQ